MIKTPLKPHPIARSLGEPFAEIGRWAVIDFGLAGLFERFERSFGKRLTWCLEILIGLAIAATCLRLVVSAVQPLYTILRDALVSPTGNRDLLDGLVIAGLIATGVATAAIIAHAIDVRRRANSLSQDAESNLRGSSKLLEEAEKTLGIVSMQAEQAEKANAQAQALLSEFREIIDEQSQPQSETNSEEEKPR